MRERAGYVGGSVSVDSSPGEGTRVSILIPWSTAAPEVGGDSGAAVDSQLPASFGLLSTPARLGGPVGRLESLYLRA